jgi:pimeloyl-ACP methyl ester carboxylesterase
VTAVTARARNGDVSIAYEVAGAGPPLLLVQGLGYGGRGWGPAHDLLAEEFTVVSFDNRGFGASDVPAGPYAVADLADDAAAVLDAAGIERATVLGVSLGGMVAQELALGRPGRVARLVLVSTTPGGLGSYPMPAQTIALMAAAPTMAPDVALRRFVANALGDDPDPELAERIVAYRTANPPDLAGWGAQAAAGATFDALDRIAALDVPTLVVHGTADAVVDPRNGELLAQRIPGARLQLVPGCGHLVSWERPELLLELVREHAA